jgi:hypothetical protein
MRSNGALDQSLNVASHAHLQAEEGPQLLHGLLEAE